MFEASRNSSLVRPLISNIRSEEVFASFSRRKRRRKRFHANQILIIIVFKKNLYDPTFLPGDFNEFLLIDIQPMKRFPFMPFIFILEMDLAEIMFRFRDAVFLV